MDRFVDTHTLLHRGPIGNLVVILRRSLVDSETNPERPIPGGHITLASGNVVLRTTADDAGSYRFDSVPEGHLFFSGFDFESGRSTACRRSSASSPERFGS